jgi:hypothetical protein
MVYFRASTDRKEQIRKLRVFVFVVDGRCSTRSVYGYLGQHIIEDSTIITACYDGIVVVSCCQY